MEHLEKRTCNMQDETCLNDLPVEEGISEIIAQKNIGTEEKTEQVMALVRERTFYSGPLPAPEQLLQYNKLPGVVSIITDMAVREQGHRHEVDAEMLAEQSKLNNSQLNYIEASIVIRKRQQLFGFVVTFILIIIGALCLFTDKNVASVCMFIAAIGSFCGIMFFGKKNKEANIDTALDVSKDDVD